MTTYQELDQRLAAVYALLTFLKTDRPECMTHLSAIEDLIKDFHDELANAWTDPIYLAADISESSPPEMPHSPTPQK